MRSCLDIKTKLMNRDQTLPENVIIIDDDEAIGLAITKILNSNGISQTIHFENGERGWESILEKAPDFIILDWRMSPLSGANILHRIRANVETQNIPILVISGYINKEDFRLAEEYLLTSLLEKPFESFFLIQNIRDLFRESKVCTDEVLKIELLLKRFSEHDTEHLEALFDIITKSSRFLTLCLFAARSLLERGNFKNAQTVLERLIEKKSDSVAAITLLAKTHLQRGEFKKSLDLLEKAQFYSPDNPDRLCLIANANMQALDLETARKNFNKAEKLDPTLNKISSGKELVRNIQNYLSRVKRTDIPLSFISLLNAIGVSLVRTEQYELGQRHYRAALEYTEQKIIKARLMFNVALGYLRVRDDKNAIEWFRKSISYGEGEFTRGEFYLSLLTSTQPNDADILSEISAHLSPESDITFADEGLQEGSAHENSIPKTVFASMSENSKNDALGSSVLDEVLAHDKTQSMVTDPKILEVQELLQKSFMPDPSLHKVTGNPELKKTHDAYAGLIGTSKVVTFVPKELRPQNLLKAEHIPIIKTRVVIVVERQNQWHKIWPTKQSA